MYTPTLLCIGFISFNFNFINLIHLGVWYEMHVLSVHTLYTMCVCVCVCVCVRVCVCVFINEMTGETHLAGDLQQLVCLVIIGRLEASAGPVCDYAKCVYACIGLWYVTVLHVCVRAGLW